MDVPALHTFRIAATEGSYAAAGRALGITQAAAAARVHGLERDLGVTLLERRGRRLHLTSAGETLLDYARRILDLVAEAERRVHEAPDQRVHVVASTVPGSYILPRVMGRFRARHPAISVVVETLDTAGVMERLATDDCDLGLTGAPAKRPGLTSIPFLEEKLVLIAPPGHPTALTTTDLSSELFVARKAGSATQAVVDEALQKAGLDLARLRIVGRLGSTQAVINAVAAGLGVAFVSPWAVGPDLAAGRVTAVTVPDLDIPRHLYIVQRRGADLSFAAQTLVDFMRHTSYVTNDV